MTTNLRSAELQQRDEQLTAEGHDPECAAFDGPETGCSCHVGAPLGVPQPRPARQFEAVPPPPAVQGHRVVLDGEVAKAWAEWRAATRDYETAQKLHREAEARWRKATQRLADSSQG